MGKHPITIENQLVTMGMPTITNGKILVSIEIRLVTR